MPFDAVAQLAASLTHLPGFTTQATSAHGNRRHADCASTRSQVYSERRLRIQCPNSRPVPLVRQMDGWIQRDGSPRRVRRIPIPCVECVDIVVHRRDIHERPRALSGIVKLGTIRGCAYTAPTTGLRNSFPKRLPFSASTLRTASLRLAPVRALSLCCVITATGRRQATSARMSRTNRTETVRFVCMA